MMIVRWILKGIKVLSHPLWFTLFGAYFFLFCHPHVSIITPDNAKWALLRLVAINTLVIPFLFGLYLRWISKWQKTEIYSPQWVKNLPIAVFVCMNIVCYMMMRKYSVSQSMIQLFWLTGGYFVVGLAAQAKLKFSWVIFQPLGLAALMLASFVKFSFFNPVLLAVALVVAGISASLGLKQGISSKKILGEFVVALLGSAAFFITLLYF